MEKEENFVFRVSENSPYIIKNILENRGWTEYDSSIHKATDWNLWWKCGFTKSEYNDLHKWQRLNHIRKASTITKKDGLFRNMNRMKIIHGKQAIDFIPETFSLPGDYITFIKKLNDQRNQQKQRFVWIYKPANLSRGRGIFLFEKSSQLEYNCSAVVQRYISNPLTVYGYKIDIRIYVLVVSYNPLIIYTYENGIVRFASEKFNSNIDINNIYAHLTNTSLNRYRSIDLTKWTINKLRYYFRSIQVDDRLIWAKILKLIIITIASQINDFPANNNCVNFSHTGSKTSGNSNTNHNNNCFELFGFDVLLDDNYKPWLLEVNLGPSLVVDCQADIEVKETMINNLIDLINLKEDDAKFQTLRKSYSKELCDSNSKKVVGTCTGTATTSSTGGKKSTNNDDDYITGAERVGEFVRVFPFEKVLEKSSAMQNVETKARSIVKSCQQLVQRRCDGDFEYGPKIWLPI